MDRDECALRNALTRGEKFTSYGANGRYSSPRVTKYDPFRYASDSFERNGALQSEMDATQFIYVGANGVPTTISGRRTNLSNRRRTAQEIGNSMA